MVQVIILIAFIIAFLLGIITSKKLLSKNAQK